jgi:hypothetical protein
LIEYFRLGLARVFAQDCCGVFFIGKHSAACLPWLL